MPVSEYVEAALYDESEGFYQAGGQAGRAGDFLTAPEVGPLFGAVIARAIDTWWRDCGCPQPFPVYEWGAGPGTLARAVIAAEPEALRSGALCWHAIERSAAQRTQHPEHRSVVSSATGPAEPSAVGVVLANELLDNLPFDLYERRGEGWFEIRIAEDLDEDRQFATVAVPLPESSGVSKELSSLVNPPSSRGAPVPGGALAPHGLPDSGGAPVPGAHYDGDPGQGVIVARQMAARDWLTDALASLRSGRVVVLDYGGTTVDLANRGAWLRTHRGHSGGDSSRWLKDPGTCDITADVAIDQLQLVRKADFDRAQAEFLQAHGIDELVAEGRQQWEQSAHIGDLSALRARSRIREAEALCDPSGMGAFRALEWLI